MAGAGGLWFYCKTHKRGHRYLIDAAIEAGYAAFGGAGVAMVLCWHFCVEPDGAAAVVGICGIAALMGWSPALILRVIRNTLIRSLPNGNGAPRIEPIPDPPSD